ncbi:BnaC05g00290D [Brassica napus]|uniref:BnaC05g00290D protein n=3 Tax=Brassica TaxID=3705 RepID=A0A078FL29_BRANA|nr:BnaC05g00290D [Brassica napus]VDD41269.1 unnamed protein product [Brassica oleracea]
MTSVHKSSILSSVLLTASGDERAEAEEATCQGHAPRPRRNRRIGKPDLANRNPKNRLPPLLPFDKPRRYSKDSQSLTSSSTQRGTPT